MANVDIEPLFMRMLEECQGIILKIARAYTTSAVDRQDLVQEILMQVWRSLPKYLGQSSQSTWIYRVALNTAISWNRKEHRRNQTQQTIWELNDVACSDHDPPQQQAQRELVDSLYRAIQQLPKADAALILLYLEDLSYDQMAEIMGISESNVGVKLNRLKKTLCDLMKEKHDES